MIPVVGELVHRHPGTISLGQGVVGYGPPREAIEAIKDFHRSEGSHKYGLVGGIPSLLEEITAKLQCDNGIELSDGEKVLVTAGGNMAFMNALLAVADPGDEIILQTPFYFNHEMAISMASCKAVLVPTDKNYQLQPELIKRAITSKTRAVVTVSPNNPTGAVYPEATLREVNQICRTSGIYHIHDEAYEYFVYDGAEHFSPGSIEGAGPCTISLFSLSKTYGFASWRIGYMVFPKDLLVSVKKVQDTLVICPPLISQVAATGAMRAGKRFCREKLTEIEKVRTTVRVGLRELEDVCQIPSVEGAFYYLLKVRTDQPPMAVVEKLIREFGVAAIPGDAFGLGDGCHLRVAYGALSDATASEGIGRLVSGLKSIVS